MTIRLASAPIRSVCSRALGRPSTIRSSSDSNRVRLPDVAGALRWTPYGGDGLFVEVGRMPGAGGLTLTGSLGDMM